MNHKYDMLALIQDTTHTPGPWKAAPLDPYRQYTLTDNEGNEIARVLRADQSEYAVINERETRLNARLIAAAPDLLAALQAIAVASPLLPSLRAIAIEAIDKATTTQEEKTHTCGACGEPCFPSGPTRGCSCDGPGYQE